MFKALNPYMLITMDKQDMPILDIWPGNTPEETDLCLYDAASGTPSSRLKWLEVAGIQRYNAKVGSRKLVNASLAEILGEFARKMDEEVVRWKDPIPPRPWDPRDSIRKWFSPYLRVATVADLHQALADDIAMLASIKSPSA